MSKYKSTLNLPETSFPMRGNLVKHEPEILKRWINDDLYGIIRSVKKGKNIFLLHDGPPYANGSIHIGHSVNKILKDIIIKSKNLSGFYSPYVPGWDCHGLPIELKVEQECAKFSKKITDAEFRIKCRKYVSTQIDKQRKDFIRLGILGDWSSPYLTMDFKTEANIIRTLSKIIKNGYLHRGNKPVYWCINCSSVIAEAEVEYYNKISPSVYGLYEAVNQDAIKHKFKCFFKEKIYIVIWTTTPWTLPASRAISVRPDFKYAVVQLKLENRALILEESLLDSVMKRVNIREYTILGIVYGIELESIRFKHPFLNFNVPVVLDNHIKSDYGTGSVNISGGHGPDDFDISMKYSLEIINLIRTDGTYLPGIYSNLDGVSIFKANEIIINIMNKNGSLLYREKIKHSYPHCWRHKTPVVFRTTPQWFIKMDHKGLRSQLLKKVSNVNWIPDWGKDRIKSMILNRPDWCISRQRTWGVPMSLFLHKETQELYPYTLEVMEEVAKLVELNGIQAWWDLNPYDLIGNDAHFYEKSLDILDVWFDSGSTQVSVVDARPEFIGYDSCMYLEGSDQHRGWFMSSLMISNIIKNKAPYHQVLTHGFVVDSKGYKMSKSIGNIISPIDIINKLGADILRLWVASNDYTSEIAISDEILKNTSNSYRRIRNTARYLLANLTGFDPIKNAVKSNKMILIDRWAVSRARAIQKEIINAYEAYNFHNVVKFIIYFCSVDMGSFYLDVIKDRQYTSRVDSLARRSCQTAMYHVIEALVRWIAPIISFTADEIWTHLPGRREKYVFTEEWYNELFDLDDSEFINNDFWNELIKIRNEVNKIIEQYRIKKIIKSSLEVAVTLYAEQELAKRLTKVSEELKFILLTSSVKIANHNDDNDDSNQSTQIKGLKLKINKADGKKCSRCWHYTNDIGQILGYVDLCVRCANTLIGNEEYRRFF